MKNYQKLRNVQKRTNKEEKYFKLYRKKIFNRKFLNYRVELGIFGKILS